MFLLQDKNIEELCDLIISKFDVNKPLVEVSCRLSMSRISNIGEMN